MLIPLRVVAVALATALFSGCGLQWLWDEPVQRAPSVTPAPSTPDPPTPDDRTARPYTGALADDSSCVKATKAQLAGLEEIGGVGIAVRYPVGVLVKSSSPWWTAAVATRVSRDSAGYEVDDYVLFVTSYPTYGDDPDHEPFAWQLQSATGDAAAAKALACVKKLPVPVEPPEPGSPDSYTGTLARRASCRAVPAKLLDRLEDAGQVGGAITYPRGTMVRANANWWTVAVATQVNPNGEGLSRDNVPATALYVTNVPSVTAKAKQVIFPVKAKKSDAAARKALACLSA